MVATAQFTWREVNGVVHTRATVPEKEPATARGPSLCGCLMRIRDKMPRVVFMAQGARRDAWWGTPEHPCAVNAVRIYPTFGQPPSPVQVHALDLVPERDLHYLATSSFEQMLYHAEWEGQVPPDADPWSVSFAHRLRKTREALQFGG
ncbi:hypothetical protein ABT324_01835 [Saccharopolyspora sp. NPDC000359]|uniref:hypothetical protein n=1 Tax=Saccharopolyspora sp. NPDC000359 TaxID=3154251 RepID=UPI00333387F3